jgi:hypothetical protein
MRGPLTVLATLTAILAVAPRLAQAAPADDARDLFARARELRAHRDCANAIPLFQKAHDVYPQGLGSLRNLAECQESVGWLASARRTWLELRRSLDRNVDPKYDGWVDDANQATARLAPMVPTLAIDVVLTTARGQPVSSSRPRSGGVDGTSDGTFAKGGVVNSGEGGVVNHADVAVSANGQPVPAELFGTPIELDPGKYTIHVAGAGIHPPPDEVVYLAPGDARRVTVRAVVEDQSPLRDVAVGTKTGGTQRSIGWASIGVGAAALLGASASLVVRQMASSDLQTKATHAGCSSQGDNFQCVGASTATRQSLQESEDLGQTANAFAIVLAAVGVAGVASGVLLVATTPSRSSEVGLTLSPSGIAAVGRF